MTPIEDGQNLIQAEALWKIYRRGAEEITALRNVSLSVQAGQFLIIAGPSGSGKSTLLHLLGGVDRPSRGRLHVNGTDLAGASEAGLTRFRRDKVGFVFQFYNLLPSLDALDNAILPLLAQGMGWKAARKAGMEILAQVGLSQRLHHTPGQLSGGEQQRVAIARALVGRPCVVLADEPTGDLDSSTAEGILSMMQDLNRRLGVTFIVASHNLELFKAAGLCYRLVDGALSPLGAS